MKKDPNRTEIFNALFLKPSLSKIQLNMKTPESGALLYSFPPKKPKTFLEQTRVRQERFLSEVYKSTPSSISKKDAMYIEKDLRKILISTGELTIARILTLDDCPALPPLENVATRIVPGEKLSSPAYFEAACNSIDLSKVKCNPEGARRGGNEINPGNVAIVHTNLPRLQVESVSHNTGIRESIDSSYFLHLKPKLTLNSQDLSIKPHVSGYFYSQVNVAGGASGFYGFKIKLDFVLSSWSTATNVWVSQDSSSVDLSVQDDVRVSDRGRVSPPFEFAFSQSPCLRASNVQSSVPLRLRITAICESESSAARPLIEQFFVKSFIQMIICGVDIEFRDKAIDFSPNMSTIDRLTRV